MLFVQQEICDGPIEGDLHVKVSRPASLGEFDFAPDRKRVEWSFLLATPLQAGQTFSFEARYHGGAGGVKHGPRAVGEFHYEQQKYPMRDPYVVVRLTDTSTFILSPNRIIPKVSYVGETDGREALRFRSGIVAKCGGVDFHIDYPLMGGTYVCEWTMGIKADLLAITP